MFVFTMIMNIIIVLLELFLLPTIVLFFVVLFKVNKLLDKIKNKY